METTTYRADEFTKAHRQQRRRAIILFIVTMLLTLAAAAAVKAGDRSEDFQRTASVDTDEKVAVKTHAGYINVESWGRDEVSVSGTITVFDPGDYDWDEVFDDIEIIVEGSGNTLNIGVKHPWKNRGANFKFFFFNFGHDIPKFTVDFDIQMPQGNPLRAQTHSGLVNVRNIGNVATLRTHSGRIEAHNIEGKLDADTHSGRIEASSIGDDAEVQTHSGRISLSDVQGHTKAQSHSGNIKLRDLAGGLRARTHGGDIDVNTLQGDLTGNTHSGHLTVDNHHGSVEWSAHSGRTSIDFRDLNIEDAVSMTSHSGSITLAVQSDVQADLKIQSNSFQSDIPMHVTAKNKKGEVTGSINGGGAKVFMKSHNGRITIAER
jgi:hypothetical protein